MLDRSAPGAAGGGGSVTDAMSRYPLAGFQAGSAWSAGSQVHAARVALTEGLTALSDMLSEPVRNALSAATRGEGGVPRTRGRPNTNDATGRSNDHSSWYRRSTATTSDIKNG